MDAGAFRDQNRQSDPLVLGLQEVVSCFISVLGAKLRSSARTVQVFKLSCLSSLYLYFRL